MGGAPLRYRFTNCLMSWTSQQNGLFQNHGKNSQPAGVFNIASVAEEA